MASAKPSPSSTTSSSSNPDTGAPAGGDEYQTSVSPKASSSTFWDTLPWNETAWCSTGQEPYLPAPMDYGQPQGELPVAVPPHITEINGPGRILPTTARPINTIAPVYVNGSCNCQMLSDNNQPLPCYMTPEAIRARNILLKCDLPSKEPTTDNDRPRRHVKHVSFSETSQSSK